MLSKSNSTGKYFWNCEEITEDEYKRILSIIENRPIAPEGYGYRLTHNLEWELFELPIEEIDEEQQTIRDKINQLEE